MYVDIPVLLCTLRYLFSHFSRDKGVAPFAAGVCDIRFFADAEVMELEEEQENLLLAQFHCCFHQCFVVYFTPMVDQLGVEVEELAQHLNRTVLQGFVINFWLVHILEGSRCLFRKSTLFGRNHG